MFRASGSIIGEIPIADQTKIHNRPPNPMAYAVQLAIAYGQLMFDPEHHTSFTASELETTQVQLEQWMEPQDIASIRSLNLRFWFGAHVRDKTGYRTQSLDTYIDKLNELDEYCSDNQVDPVRLQRFMAGFDMAAIDSVVSEHMRPRSKVLSSYHHSAVHKDRSGTQDVRKVGKRERMERKDARRVVREARPQKPTPIDLLN